VAAGAPPVAPPSPGTVRGDGPERGLVGEAWLGTPTVGDAWRGTELPPLLHGEHERGDVSMPSAESGGEFSVLESGGDEKL
jgi:hypothetical protein